MNNKIWISSLTFSDNTKIDFLKNEIVVIVGPNNAGKSATLKESAKLLRNKNDKGKVVKDITIEKQENEEIFSFLEKFSTRQYTGNTEPHYNGFGYSLHSSTVRHWWENYSNGVGDLFPVFINTLSTEQRLQAANPPGNISLTTEAIQHPIHFLQRDDSLEKKFSEYFRQAFGTDLIVHRNAGNIVPLYIGERPIPKEGEDRVSIDYIKKIERLDLLHEQGDGMRGFVGVLLSAFISNHSILFIDEPEAFLHPPQARLLGKMLAKDFPSDRQMFLSTHSEDFLKGLLDSEVENLKIIRINRNGLINNVNVLNNTEVHSIWDDSLLRHSNVLNGLFHTKVIICESDSDCRFFSALLNSQYSSISAISPDILFIHCGGKHRIPTAIKALKKLNVDVRVVTDFDVLNDINPIKYIVEDLGADWTSLENDWRLVKNEIERKRPEFLTSDLKTEIEHVFDETPDRIFPKVKVKMIESALKKASAWSEAKEVGKAYIPRGNATQAFERIQSSVQRFGFYILEVGELECFAKSIGNHGPKWVSDVLHKDLLTDPELEEARVFVRMITD